MSLSARLRPNVPYLLSLSLFAAGAGYGLARAGAPGVVITVGAGVLLALFGYPVLVSTAFRVPVITVGEDGIRLPLMGPSLSWSEISSVRRDLGRGHAPVLLIFPADSRDAVRQLRPWLRPTARRDIARHGTPIVVSDLSLDRSIDDIAAAVRRYLPD